MNGWISGLLAAFIVAGCATTNVAEVKGAPSGFLGKDAARLKPGEVSKGQAGLRYYDEAAPWRTYTKVLLEPVTFWGDDSTKVAPADQQALGTYFNSALDKAFAEKFEMVTTAAPGVLRLQVAVTDLEAATPGLRTISLVVPQARVLSTVGSMATGKQVFAGWLQVEAKLTDAQTGRLLSAVIARGIGGGSVKAAAQVEWGDAQNAMDLFARRAAANLHALTTGKATVAELPLPD
jgi:Protein of unknown function (DUF3313)